MALIADILLGAGALGAAAYCLVLARRLRRFTELESGMGGAIAVLSAQVDEMTRALACAQAAAAGSAATLEAGRQRAEAAAQRIELLVAALHDLPAPASAQPPRPAVPPAAATAAATAATAAAATTAAAPGGAAATLSAAAAAATGGWAGAAAAPGGAAELPAAERRARFVRHRGGRGAAEAAE